MSSASNDCMLSLRILYLVTTRQDRVRMITSFLNSIREWLLTSHNTGCCTLHTY